MRSLKNLSKLFLRQLFEVGQRFGFDVLPRHFYSETPVIHQLKKDDAWREPFSMVGVQGADIDAQMGFVKQCINSDLVAHQKKTRIHYEACQENGEEGFGPIESDFLFCFIASQKPARIIQIGSGVSTAICRAAARHVGYSPKITCIDPYPTGFLKKLESEKAITLIEEKVELLDLSFLNSLEEGDFFFVDSTHTLGPAGEVSRIVLEMLPRLSKGCLVHFHDITFPYDYSPGILSDSLFFVHESVLLHAFLAGNSNFKILASLSMLHNALGGKLSQWLPNYQPAGMEYGMIIRAGHFPSSAYLLVT